jgi:hypothetical protein
MFKVSIDKELEKKASAAKEEFLKDPIEEVRLLLQENESEKAKVLRGLSSESNFARVEKMRGKQIELEKLENGYHGNVYTTQQIKEMCMDYHLRFLPSKLYTGSFDVEVAGKVIEFSKKTNTPIEDYSLRNSFYILAPESDFELKDEKHITKKQRDPALFYKIDDTHYRLIHKWGEDFTVFRLLEGFSYRSWWAHLGMNTLFILPIFTFLLALITPIDFFEYKTVWFFVLSILMSSVFSYFRWGWGKHDDGDQINGFFTPHNWRSDSKIRS